MASPLGTLLATRLDAMLGTTLAQHPVLLEGAKPHGTAQPASAIHPQDSTILREQGRVGERRGLPPGVTRSAGQTADAAGGTRGQTLPGGVQASAQATLSESARTILALLVSRPRAESGVRGQMPLWTGAQAASTAAGQSAAGAGGLVAGQGQPAGGAGPALGAAAPGGASAATSAAPLPPGPPEMARQLAQALGRAVGLSGVFYESHLSDLAFGKRSLAELLKEPQALLHRAAPAGEAGAPRSAGAAGADEAASRQAAGPGPGPAAGTGNPAGPPIPGIHADAATLVRLQLETLANAAFNWQGEAWPGARMQWDIAEHAAAPEAGETASWSSRLLVHLPRLGEVEARLTLAQNQLVLRLVAPESADRLQPHTDVLRARLQAAGVTLSDLSVLARTPQTEDAP